MRVKIQRQEIRRVLGGRYEDLHRSFLGTDLSGRGVAPIYQNVFYVTYRDPVGWELFRNDAPAMCEFSTGNIYCYHAQSLPLTEARLVHEFVHRAARFRPSIGVWSSGVIINPAWKRINEALTEYLVSLVCGEERYGQIVAPANRYLLYLPSVRRVESLIGRQALVRAYLEHDTHVLEDFVTPAGESGMLRFR